MGVIDWIVGRLGGIDPKTGERVRLRARPSDERGHTMDVVQRKSAATGEWKDEGVVPGSITGGY